MLGSGDEGSDSFAFILSKEVDDTEKGGVKCGGGAFNFGAFEVEKKLQACGQVVLRYGARRGRCGLGSLSLG